MNKSFMLLDKNNNLQKIADVIVSFNFEGKDYLIYSIEENEQNSQIFVSRLILNSEGKTFIDNILPEEKGKLNNIVYNIVILIPNEAQKGASFETLTGNLFDKFSVKLSSLVSNLDQQEYYGNCSVAITSKLLVKAAVEYYDNNLKDADNNSIHIPTWTAPVEVTAPVPAEPTPVNNVEPMSVPTNIVPVQENQTISDLNLDSTVTQSVSSVPTSATEVVNHAPVEEEKIENIQPNPQVQKLAIVSDPSLGIGVRQPNIGKNKKAGFANTKYVVLGTICLVLAVAVVITAYILISNVK